jgi:hypothetical protein
MSHQSLFNTIQTKISLQNRLRNQPNIIIRRYELFYNFMIFFFLLNTVKDITSNVRVLQVLAILFY